jgi:hypothetical protein
MRTEKTSAISEAASTTSLGPRPREPGVGLPSLELHELEGRDRWVHDNRLDETHEILSFLREALMNSYGKKFLYIEQI